jgi:hypothetical protein
MAERMHEMDLADLHNHVLMGFHPNITTILCIFNPEVSLEGITDLNEILTDYLSPEIQETFGKIELATQHEDETQVMLTDFPFMWAPAWVLAADDDIELPYTEDSFATFTSEGKELQSQDLIKGFIKTGVLRELTDFDRELCQCTYIKQRNLPLFNQSLVFGFKLLDDGWSCIIDRPMNEVTQELITEPVARIYLPVTDEQIHRWCNTDDYVQDVFPTLSPELREFLLTGLTPDEQEV